MPRANRDIAFDSIEKNSEQISQLYVSERSSNPFQNGPLHKKKIEHGFLKLEMNREKSIYFSSFFQQKSNQKGKRKGNKRMKMKNRDFPLFELLPGIDFFAEIKNVTHRGS